ncbi:3-deoxy-7-phosphoheptulonate synthase [Candidatus Woesearchaeota archaeon]|nr:3-deoxy-7-phosphoheptulonate synthase [Candidatus Woesearchaeota archaeon]
MSSKKSMKWPKINLGGLDEEMKIPTSLRGLVALLEDRNIDEYNVRMTPEELRQKVKMTPKAAYTVVVGREIVKRIMDGKDPRIIIEAGPCSIDDVKAAYEFAKRLKRLSDKVDDVFFIMMRAYFEKPRTNIGWRGLIEDPRMDGSDKVDLGFELARKLLRRINELGLPTITEYLHTETPQYIGDFISRGVIGARTVTSCNHRKMMSGISCPGGFKNTVDGQISPAVDAVRVAGMKNTFRGEDYKGRKAKIHTRGNEYVNINLRGGAGPNLNPESIDEALALLDKHGLRRNIEIDCSHGNSSKDYRRQMGNLSYVMDQRRGGRSEIFAAMIEAYLMDGSYSDNDIALPYPIREDTPRIFGLSKTDGCVGFDAFESGVMLEYEKFKQAGWPRVK